MARSEQMDETAIKCADCGHVRQTTEEYPTLVACEECGSGNVHYAEEETDDE